MRAAVSKSWISAAMLVWFGAGLFGAEQVHAEIVTAGPNGFSLRHTAEAPNVAPPVIWAALSDVAKWWDPEHTYSGDSRNLTLEPLVRGCFCEKLGLYAGIEHKHCASAARSDRCRSSASLAR
jgi:hypothetical protein